MKTNFINLNLLAILMLIFCVNANAQLIPAGKSKPRVINSPHPYLGSSDGSFKKVWSETIREEGVAFVMVHFDRIELGEGDYIIVKSPITDRSWTYREDEINMKGGKFWSIYILGEELIIEIYSKNSVGAYGYSIDMVQRGFHIEEMPQSFSICGADDTQEARCYQITDPAKFTASHAVARLLTVKSNGSFWGTGWLVGSDDHMMTNEHVITSQTEANNTTYEFMALGGSCATDCTSPGACSGTIFASSATFIQDNTVLDYCLLQIPDQGGTSASSTYGFLQMRSKGPVIGERIYIPQHPAGWGRRIAVTSDNAADVNGFPIIQSLTESGCYANSNSDEVGYWADTRGGSSGSPVLSHRDNLVIALHHCKGDAAGCGDMNRGVQIQKIITDLGASLPPNSVYCPIAINITADVDADEVDIKSASATITASNNIELDGTAIYNAGDKLVFHPGFRAKLGSSLMTKLEGCN